LETKRELSDWPYSLNRARINKNERKYGMGILVDSSSGAFIAFLAVIGNMKKDPAMDIFNKYKTHAAQDKTTQQS